MKATGQYARVTIDVDGTPVDVMELREWSVSAESEKLDSTVAGSDWEEHQIGHISWEADATCLSVDQFWLDRMDQKLTLNLYDSTEDTDPVYRGTASMDFERSVPYDDMIESSLTFTGSGPLEHPTTTTTV